MTETHQARIAETEAQIDLCEGESEREKLLLELADLLEESDPERAAQRLEQLIELSPHCAAAFPALARCYEKLGLWDAAVYAHEREIEATDDAEARISAHCSMARILLDQLAVEDRAFESLSAALELDPERASTLAAISHLHARRGEAAKAISTLERSIARQDDPEAKCAALLRLASLEHESDPIAAQDAYRAVLELDPAEPVALAALRTYALDLGDVAEGARLLDREQQVTRDSVARARLLVELAVLRRDRLDDPSGARALFEEAYALDRENEDAVLAVAEGKVERGEWSVVTPILDRLARTATQRPEPEQRRIFGHLGRARLAKGDPARALEAFRKATHVGSTDTAVLRGLVECAVVEGEPEEALLAQRRLLDVIGEDDLPARADAHHRLGILHADLFDTRRARFAWEKALECDPSHRGALRALLDGAFGRGDLGEAVRLEDRLLDATIEPDARLLLLRESAKRWGGLEPERTLALLERLIAEDDVTRRAAHLRAAGTILRELGEESKAIAMLSRAFELDPTEETFRSLDASLEGDDQARERAHLAMVSRAQADGDRALEFELWHAIGAMRRARGDVNGSLVAFRSASQLKPDDSAERRLVAELYVATDQTDLAIAEMLAAVDREPLEPTHHKALYALFTRSGDLDRAFCVAAVLSFLKAADGEQRACFTELRPKGVPHFRSALTRAVTLRSLVHADLDRDLSTLFGLVARAARTAKGRSVHLPPYTNATREDPRSTTKIAAKAFFGAANVLGIPAPELLVRPELPTMLHALSLEAKTSLMGSNMLSGWSVPELFFIAGKHLVSQQGEHAVRAEFPVAAELDALRDATIEAVCPGTFGPAVRRTADVLVRELTRPEGVELKKAIFAAPAVQQADVERWMRGSELTALRAGLLLCGDLSVAAKIVRLETVLPGDPTPNDKVKELVRFAVSADYHALRASLGIAGSRRVPDDDDEPTIERKLCA